MNNNLLLPVDIEVDECLVLGQENQHALGESSDGFRGAGCLLGPAAWQGRHLSIISLDCLSMYENHTFSLNSILTLVSPM